jgi:hypothetical protein
MSAAYLLSAVGLAPARHRVLIPADKPFAIADPMRVDVLTDDGDRGIRIPNDVGRGWCGEAGGLARYRCYVPADGHYTLWASCLWGGVCTNAIYVQVDDLPRVILGNDSDYQRWHWVRGTTWPLTRGTHTLTVSNHSDGIAIQKFALLSDPLDRPNDGTPGLYDLFYDDFDGCDGGNIAAWRLSGKEWHLFEPVGNQDYAHRVLAGKAPSGGAPISAVVGDDSWHDCTVNISMRVVSAGRVALALGYQSKDDGLRCEWRVPETGPTRLSVLQQITGQRIPLGEIDTPMKVGRWHDLGLTAGPAELRVSLDGTVIGRFPFEGLLNGPLALLVGEGATVWFDEVHVRLAEAMDRYGREVDPKERRTGHAAHPCRR